MANIIDDASSEPGAVPADITHATANGDGWFGHPQQLKRLFTIEMWERFGYYGMRTLLTLYLTKHFLFGDQQAGSIYGGFTALVYLTPLVGGLLADAYLGYKRAVKFGAILMALGYFILCFGGEAAKPFAKIEGQRYEITEEGKGDAATQFIIDRGQKLAIKSNDDGSVSLNDGAGKEVRHLAKDGFVQDPERNSLYISIMLLALSLVTVGNGFFKPNISTVVGALYSSGDPRKDAGFTMFYMGINLGAFISQFLCPILGDAYGAWAGFLLAALGMALSWVLVQYDGGRLAGYGEPPTFAGPDRSKLIYLCALLAVPVLWLLFSNLLHSPKIDAKGDFWVQVAALPLLTKLLFVTFIVSIPGILFWSYRVGSKAELQMMLAAMVLVVFNVVFWTLFEQAGSSLTLFADRNTVRDIEWSRPLFAAFRAAPALYYAIAAAIGAGLGWVCHWFFSHGEDAAAKRKMALGFVALAIAIFAGLAYAKQALISNEVYNMPAGQFQVFNSIFIVILAPIFSGIWGWLRAKNAEPSIPIKFGLALMGVGAGFLFLVWGTSFVGADYKVGMVWLIGLYFIHSAAELCISPVGLSMITKLSIARIVGLMMGVWFLSISVAQNLAGIIAQVTSVDTIGGKVANLKVSLDTYMGTYQQAGLITVGIGVILIVLAPLIKKWMHGVN